MTDLIHLFSTNVCPHGCGLPTAQANSGTIAEIMRIAFGAIGGLALLMITVSGLRYVLAAGDPQKMSKAKDGIVYSLVGLAIAIAAESIVSFVAGRL